MQEIISKKNIGARLKELRDSRNLSQAEVSEVLGLSRSHYSQVELGKQFPSYLVLSKVTEFYGCNYEWILHGGDQHKKAAASLDTGNESIHDAGSQVDGQAHFITLVNSEDSLLYLKKKNEASFIAQLPKISLPLPQLGNSVYRGFQVEGDHLELLLFDQDLVVGELITDHLRMVISRNYVMVLKNKICIRKIYEYNEEGSLICSPGHADRKEEIKLDDILELWEIKLKISFKLNKTISTF